MENTNPQSKRLGACPGGGRPPSEWSSPLVRELGIMLALKSLALFLIWWFFFSDPIDETLTDAQVSEAVLGPTPGTDKW